MWIRTIQGGNGFPILYTPSNNPIPTTVYDFSAGVTNSATTVTVDGVTARPWFSINATQRMFLQASASCFAAQPDTDVGMYIEVRQYAAIGGAFEGRIGPGFVWRNSFNSGSFHRALAGPVHYNTGVVGTTLTLTAGKGYQVVMWMSSTIVSSESRFDSGDQLVVDLHTA